MASQLFNQAPANPSGSQVDLTLRLGLPNESDKILSHFGRYANPAPMNPQHVQSSFTGPYTRATNHFDMVSGRSGNILGQQAYDTNHSLRSPNHYLNPNGTWEAAGSVGGGPLYTNSHNYTSIPPMPHMNDYILLKPSRRAVAGSFSSSKNSSRSQECVPNYNDPNKRCTNYNCATNNTPMWRKGPLGPKSLCNACGIRYRKEEEKMIKAKEAVENSACIRHKQSE